MMSNKSVMACEERLQKQTHAFSGFGFRGDMRVLDLVHHADRLTFARKDAGIAADATIPYACRSVARGGRKQA